MKRISKNLLALLAAFAVFGPLCAGNSQDASSSIVPAGDPTYTQLNQLEKTGLLPEGSSEAPLTRLQVGERIFNARTKMREIVLAQAVSPAPETAPSGPSSAGTSTTAQGKVFETTEDLAQAEQNLRSLEDAYQYELKKVQGDARSEEEAKDKLEGGQYELWKRLLGITEYPTITWHGVGRAYGFSREYFGDNTALAGSNNPLDDATRGGLAFLDFDAIGIVDKQIRWSALIRYESSMEANSSVGIDSLLIRRANLEFHPPWLSATIGDFDESYTPLTMWNRDSLDLKYMPEMYQRQDDFEKYESFFNHEPDWPFRGLRIGTDIYWPDSGLLDRFKVEGMANMIRSGFNDNSSGGTYFGPGFFTDWIFAGKGELQLKRWYMGGFSLQTSMDVYGIMLDEPLYSQQPNSPYSPFNPATWAHQYQIGSIKPTVDIGLGGDASFGGVWEGVFSTYQDDVENAATKMSDYAVLGGPYLKLGASKINFNFLDVGPNFYSPLAQTRQDNLNPANTALGPAVPLPDFLSPPTRSQFFLSNVPRASDIFGFYDRTQDSTFPYGLATPNRAGYGLELDVKAMENQALKVPAAVYFVHEISGNMVSNLGATGFAPVDGNAGTRNFTYANVGPSLNLGPFLHTDDLEVGVNVRYENTSDSTDNINLTSTWILGGARAKVFQWWAVAASFGTQSFNGTEEGYLGSTIARYSYSFNNQDLGLYLPFNINGSRQSMRVSSTFNMSRNSNLYLDYDMTTGAAIPYAGTSLPGTLNDQYMEITYEVQF